MSEADVRFLRRSDIAETMVEDDIFLVVPETEAIFHLNAIGTALWRLLTAPRSRDELVALLAAAFSDVSASRIAADVDMFLARLRDGGLVAAQESGIPGQGRINPSNRRP